MNDWTGKGSYAGSGLLTAVGAWTINEWAAAIGITLAIATFGLNAWYKKRMLEKTEEHYSKSRKIQRGRNGDDTS